MAKLTDLIIIVVSISHPPFHILLDIVSATISWFRISYHLE